MTSHLASIAGITILIALGMLYPFLPGKYDGLAVPLSTLAQLLGTAGLLLVPIGVPWLVYEARKRAGRPRKAASPGGGYYFAVGSLIGASVLVLAVSLVVLFGISVSVGVATVVLWLYAVAKLIPRLRLLRQAESERINPTPLYLLSIPILTVVLQAVLAGPATELSRDRAIRNSAELIAAIERHHAEQGRYPSSLLAVWKDYHPSVVGVEQFHYAPSSSAYSLFFEQPRFLFDNVGTREFVMYNRLDEHVMPSHASWILIWTPERLEGQQGWYAVHDTSFPHWKYFWFD